MGELITVKWGATMSRIEEDEHGVTAYFEDGSNAKGASFPVPTSYPVTLSVKAIS
jgi:hypothetical protein